MRILRWLSPLLLTACVESSFNGVVFEPAEPAPTLVLADSSGKRFDLAAERDRVTLVFFGYTHCPDVCPTTLLDWRAAADSLGDERAARVGFVFVSVDPERDTPAIAQRYAARFNSRFLGLTGSRTEIDSLLARWHVAAFRDGTPGAERVNYTVTHPSQVFVIDRTGKLRLMQRQGLTPVQIAADIKELL
jgi:protein SCO1